MKINVLLLVTFAVITACKKERHTPLQAPTLHELLVSKPWMLEAYGFDDNANGMIDSSENMITDCQKDNTYEFRADGTAIFLDNDLICGDSATFTLKWKMLDSGRLLDLQYYVAPVIHLEERKMILGHQNLAASFRVIYKR